MKIGTFQVFLPYIHCSHWSAVEPASETCNPSREKKIKGSLADPSHLESRLRIDTRGWCTLGKGFAVLVMFVVSKYF